MCNFFDIIALLIEHIVVPLACARAYIVVALHSRKRRNDWCGRRCTQVVYKFFFRRQGGRRAYLNNKRKIVFFLNQQFFAVAAEARETRGTRIQLLLLKSMHTHTDALSSYTIIIIFIKIIIHNILYRCAITFFKWRRQSCERGPAGGRRVVVGDAGPP